MKVCDPFSVRQSYIYKGNVVLKWSYFVMAGVLSSFCELEVKC